MADPNPRDPAPQSRRGGPGAADKAKRIGRSRPGAEDRATDQKRRIGRIGRGDRWQKAAHEEAGPERVPRTRILVELREGVPGSDRIYSVVTDRPISILRLFASGAFGSVT